MSGQTKGLILLWYCLASCWVVGLEAKSDLQIVAQWAELDFVFPSEGDRRNALQNEYYVPGKSVPIDVDVQHISGYRPRIFVTIPRFDIGRPITLGTLDNQGLINAYPDYSWHDNQGKNCAGMTSVFRVAIDKYQRLWVMDTGKIGRQMYCPPQVLAFDLTTDRLIYRHILNISAYTDQSLFITPVVDVRENGDTFVYVADVLDFGILVVDVLRDRSWWVTHRLFFPYPPKGDFTIDGDRFNLMDGILGLALSPYVQGYERNLYFHALASTTENVISTAVLRNESYINNSKLDLDAVYVFPKERPSQSAAEAMDRNGIMYFGMMDPPSIWCWNTNTEYSIENLHAIAFNQETLQFASGLKVVTNVNGEQELWVLTSSFQRILAGTISSQRINYRIHAEKISTLLQNSRCRESKEKPWSSFQDNNNVASSPMPYYY